MKKKEPTREQRHLFVKLCEHMGTFNSTNQLSTLMYVIDYANRVSDPVLGQSQWGELSAEVSKHKKRIEHRGVSE